jgi:hypothetical protein
MVIEEDKSNICSAAAMAVSACSSGAAMMEIDRNHEEEEIGGGGSSRTAGGNIEDGEPAGDNIKHVGRASSSCMKHGARRDDLACEGGSSLSCCS